MLGEARFRLEHGAKMRILFLVLFLFCLFVPASFGQATNRGDGLVFGKKPEDPPLANPYHVPAGRDDIVKVIQRILEEQEVPLNVDESKPANGQLSTQKVIYSKGTHVREDLQHFGNLLQSSTRNWTKARVALSFKIDPIDPGHSELFIMAKFEGLSVDAGISSEWVAISSRGTLEDCFMHSILEQLGVLAPTATSKEAHLCLKLVAK